MLPRKSFRVKSAVLPNVQLSVITAMSNLILSYCTVSVHINQLHAYSYLW